MARLSKETIRAILTLSVDSFWFAAFHQRWKLSVGLWIQIVSWISRSCASFQIRKLIMLDCVYQLFNRIFQKVEFSHFDLLTFLDSGLNSIKTRVIQLLGLDEHRHPLILLALQVFDYSLMIDQMFFIFGKVLCTNILNLFKFFIILDIYIIIIFIHIWCFNFDERLQFIIFSLNLFEDRNLQFVNFIFCVCFGVSHTFENQIVVLTK